MKHPRRIRACNPSLLAANLIKLRLQHGYSVYDVSRQAGIPHTTLGNIERGDSSFPSFDVIYKLSQLYNVTVEYLNGDEVQMSSRNRAFFRAFMLATPGTKSTLEQMLNVITHEDS